MITAIRVILFVLIVFLFIEFILHLLMSGRNKFTRFTRMLIAPTIVISDRFYKGKRKWQITLAITLIMLGGVIFAAFKSGDEIVDAAIDNIPIINSAGLFMKYFTEIPVREFAFFGLSGIIAILIADIIRGLIIGEGDRKNSRIFIIGYAPLLVITSVISAFVIEKLGVREGVDSLLAGNGISFVIGRIICGYLLFLFLISYFEEIFVFIGIVGISSATFPLYYNSYARTADEYVTGLILDAGGYDNVNELFEALWSVPSWVKLVVCMVVITGAAFVTYLLDLMFDKLFHSADSSVQYPQKTV